MEFGMPRLSCGALLVTMQLALAAATHAQPLPWDEDAFLAAREGAQRAERAERGHAWRMTGCGPAWSAAGWPRRVGRARGRGEQGGDATSTL